ncbi:MAG: porin [Planctomycetia bacterium]|nr:porin [Planctomycetia bacterium]
MLRVVFPMTLWMAMLGGFSALMAEETSIAEPAEISASKDFVQVPAKEWETLQKDLETIKTQLKEDKEKAEKKKEEEKEKKFRTPQTKVIGRFFFDAAAGTQNDANEQIHGDYVSGTQFRQACLGIKGTLYDMIEYDSTLDWASGKVASKNLYMGFYNLPGGVSYRVGNFKEPWSMEELVPYPASMFIEKSDLNNMKTICGGRNNGVMMHNWHNADRMTWAAGLFAASMTETNLDCFCDSENIAFTGRMTFLPFYEECPDGSKYLWHIGGSYSFRKYDQARADSRGTSIRLRADNAIATPLMESGTLWGLDLLNAFLIESSIVRGAFSIDFEHAVFLMDDNKCGDVTAQAGYVQVSYFLTGESRNYNKKGGTFAVLDPKCPFVRICRDGMGVFSGPGAWEVAYRFAWTDIGELARGYKDATLGTTLTNAFGINWYLNRNCRMMFNYILAKSDYEGKYEGMTGWEHVFATRFQITW